MCVWVCVVCCVEVMEGQTRCCVASVSVLCGGEQQTDGGCYVFPVLLEGDRYTIGQTDWQMCECCVARVTVLCGGE